MDGETVTPPEAAPFSVGAAFPAWPFALCRSPSGVTADATVLDAPFADWGLLLWLAVGLGADKRNTYDLG